jgi:putative endonuclease
VRLQYVSKTSNMRVYEFYFYITTNPTKTVLYCGATNNISQRLIEHYLSRGKQKTFAGRYNCYNLVYIEFYKYVMDAFARELQVKGWTRAKKIALIESANPTWRFMNEDFLKWPPPPDSSARG